MFTSLTRVLFLTALAVLAGCAAPERHVDYTAFRDSKPTSILVLPPLNESVEPQGAAAVLAQVTYPLAESGYYVIPVAVMEETLRQNGVTVADDAHQIPPSKLREIFGADAVLYLKVKQYGSAYQVLASVTTVEVDAALVDLRNGKTLWNGSKTIADSGGSGQNIIGALVQALADQVANSLSDRAYGVAAMTNNQLLSAGVPGGILYGPRSPHYELDNSK